MTKCTHEGNQQATASRILAPVSRSRGPAEDVVENRDQARWATIADVRGHLPSSGRGDPQVRKTVTVFNVGGNKFRLIVAIVYHAHTVYIKHVLTHSEYGR